MLREEDADGRHNSSSHSSSDLSATRALSSCSDVYRTLRLLREGGINKLRKNSSSLSSSASCMAKRMLAGFPPLAPTTISRLSLRKVQTYVKQTVYILSRPVCIRPELLAPRRGIGGRCGGKRGAASYSQPPEQELFRSQVDWWDGLEEGERGKAGSYSQPPKQELLLLRVV
jgi:hypothetical protein